MAALVELGRAADLDRDSARYAYTRYAYLYGVAPHSAGRQQEALTYLKDSLFGHFQRWRLRNPLK